jgi:hypothetical protein
MMRRFGRIDPTELAEIQARRIDPLALKQDWLEMVTYADTEIQRIADTMPDLPIGIAFTDASGQPGWIGNDPLLAPHRPCIRGCLPRIVGD